MAYTNTTPGYLYTGDFEDKVYGCTALEKHTSGYKLIQLKSVSIDSDTVSYEDMCELMYAIDDGKFFTVDICGDIYSHVSAFMRDNFIVIPIGLSENSESIEDAIANIVISSGGSQPKSSAYMSSGSGGGPSYSDGQLHCIFNPAKYAQDLNANWHLRVFIEDVPAKDSSDWKLVDDRKNPYVNQINSRLSDKTAEVTELNRQIKELNTKMNKLYIRNFSHFCEGGLRIYEVDRENTSKGVNFSYMYNECVQSFGVDLDTSNGTDFSYMFNDCQRITNIKLTNTSKGKNFSHMFNACLVLTTIPNLDTSNGTDFSYMFYNCLKVTSIPELNTGNGTIFSNMFDGCFALTTIPEFDIGNGTNFEAMFRNCYALTNLKIKNIRQSLKISDGTSWGHLLTLESLLFIIGELITAESSQTLTVGSANLEKLANVYVKTIAITDEMRAADANIDAKRPFEVCESTDEGAMSITNYASSKKWTIN